jgi:hypothetical protein
MSTPRNKATNGDLIAAKRRKKRKKNTISQIETDNTRLGIALSVCGHQMSCRLRIAALRHGNTDLRHAFFFLFFALFVPFRGY